MVSGGCGCGDRLGQDIANYPGGMETVLTGRVAFNNRQPSVSKSLQTHSSELKKYVLCVNAV